MRWLNKFSGNSHLELDGPDGAEPLADLRRILSIHVEEVRHYRFDDWLALVVGCHRHNASKDFERTAIPVLHNVMVCGESSVNESPEALTDFFSAFP